MKSIILKSVWAFALIALLFSCKKDENLRDTKVTEVKSLYEPANNKSLVLQSTGGASVYFEWEPAKAEDSGMVLYEVAFDKEGGNFSNPIYKMASDNNGAYNHATISHKVLDKVLALAGVEPGNTGKLIWTVISSKGINELKSPESRTLSATRLVGFPDVVEAYLTGEATEAGADLSKAIAMKSISTGVFEVYTKLEAGKSYSFKDGKTSTALSYYPESGIIKAGNTLASVDHTGIYHITLDFSTASFTIDEVTRVDMHVMWKNLLVELQYLGNGEWGTLVDFSNRTDIDDDERYKFKVTTKALGRKDWISVESHDNAPSGQDAWWHVKADPDNDDDTWDDGHVWKLTSRGWNGKKLDVKFILNPSGAYTHSVVQK